MSNHGYYQSSGKTVGPCSPDELKRLASLGVITRSTLVRRGNDGEWIVAGRVKGLFGSRPSDAVGSPVDQQESSAITDSQVMPLSRPEGSDGKPSNSISRMVGTVTRGKGRIAASILAILLLVTFASLRWDRNPSSTRNQLTTKAAGPLPIHDELLKKAVHYQDEQIELEENCISEIRVVLKNLSAPNPPDDPGPAFHWLSIRAKRQKRTIDEIAQRDIRDHEETIRGLREKYATLPTLSLDSSFLRDDWGVLSSGGRIIEVLRRVSDTQFIGTIYGNDYWLFDGWISPEGTQWEPSFGGVVVGEKNVDIGIGEMVKAKIIKCSFDPDQLREAVEKVRHKKQADTPPKP